MKKTNIYKGKNRSTKTKTKTFLFLAVLITFILISGYFIYSMDLFNLKSSSAKSKYYSKTYAAGDMVEKKTIKVVPGQYLPSVRAKSLGSKIKFQTKPGGPKINGWRTPRTTVNSPSQTVYISKVFTIPKPENTRNRPMAVQLCWKSTTWDAAVNVVLSRDSERSWLGSWTSPIAYQHTKESTKTARKLGCWGYSQYIWTSDDYNKGDLVNKEIKARIVIMVTGGPIDIAAIRVKSIDLPSGDYTNMRADYNTGKLFTDQINPTGSPKYKGFRFM